MVDYKKVYAERESKTGLSCNCLDIMGFPQMFIYHHPRFSFFTPPLYSSNYLVIGHKVK